MSDTLPSLNALRAFNETARELSVTRAAQNLHVTHGAVSRQLRQLEEQLGVTLFKREGRGLVLTAEGDQLRASTSQAFEQLAQACDQLKRRAADAPIVLSCSGSFLARWFIPRLDKLQRQCPELKLHLTASEEAQWPLGPGVDVALRFAEPPWPGDAQVIDLAPELMGPVMKPELLQGLSAEDPESLYALPLLHTQSRAQAWPLWFAAKGLEVTRIRRDQAFEHLNYMLEAALVGLGVAIAPAYLVEEDLRAGRLVAPWGFIETPARVGLWLPAGENRPLIHRLIEWLQQELSGDTQRSYR
ncbi:HTH-type transcriptional regulator TrpI [Marinobacterium zhoushanense]|uniref:HTH-type transcriptional regulator TrpI n=1 Tax=Marinobacterium zhoushanense TaxID=1679163 RepID=A0ABQ1KJ16_9GAMM|nr:LysR family transcriptional regulator [Marinobacterium zhoushanense]GGC01940.1 HTH-type transcriptional regulator TrpI [Marinobacterium zhoushanense]